MQEDRQYFGQGDENKNKEVKRLEDLILCYKKVFKSEEGEKVLEDLRNTTGFHSGNFDKDPYAHAYNEGARSIVCRISNLVKTDLEKIREQMSQDISRKEEGVDGW
jgi:hypothetical protein